MKRRYKITYHNRTDKVECVIMLKSDHLPSHDDIIAVLDHVMPKRAGDGWYKMETIAKGESPNGRAYLDLSHLQSSKT